MEQTRVLNVVYRSATAIGSRLPSMASAKARVVGASALLRPVSSSTQVMLRVITTGKMADTVFYTALCAFECAEHWTLRDIGCNYFLK